MHLLTFATGIMLMATVSLSAPVPSENIQAPASAAPTLAKRDYGAATVINNCGYDVTLDRVTDVDSGMQQVVPASGGSWSEPYQTRADGGGISVKINGGDGGPPVQFEYTIDPEMSMVFYDLSLIDGNPFGGDFQTIVPDDGTCPQVTCQPGEIPCAAAYNNPDENPATHGCPQVASLTYYLCGGP